MKVMCNLNAPSLITKLCTSVHLAGLWRLLGGVFWGFDFGYAMLWATWLKVTFTKQYAVLGKIGHYTGTHRTQHCFFVLIP